jgi:hypothetical protein
VRLLGAVALAAVACAASPAVAQPVVEVRAIPDQPVPRELVDTLRIYLASSATVELGPALTATTLDARIAEASAGLGSGALVTWLERPPQADGAYTVVVVGERGGRAAVEVGKLEGPDTAAVSRLLALRIGAFLDESLTAGPASPLAATPLTRAAPPPPPTPAPALAVIAELGAGTTAATGVDGLDAEGGLGIGVRRRFAAYAIEAVALGRLGWPRTFRAESGDSVELATADVAAGARFVVTRGRVWLGAALELGARRVRAEAMTTDGARGGAVRWLPIARVGVDVRVGFGAIGVRATLGIERGLGTEQFTVRGAEMATAGRLAGVADLGLSIPLNF